MITRAKQVLDTAAVASFHSRRARMAEIAKLEEARVKQVTANEEAAA